MKTSANPSTRGDHYLFFKFKQLQVWASIVLEELNDGLLGRVSVGDLHLPVDRCAHNIWGIEPETDAGASLKALAMDWLKGDCALDDLLLPIVPAEIMA